MFHVIYGRAGSGKTTHLLQEAKRRCAAGESGQLYLVPETASHEAERQLCMTLGNSASLSCEVMTFRRLARYVFAHLGGMAALTPDGGAQMMLMYRAYEQVKEQLQVYGKARRADELLTGLLALYEECSSGCITAPMLAHAADGCEGTLAGKLADLSLLFGAYEQIQRDTLLDPRDELERVEGLLKASDLFMGATLYIDGFEGFTPRERTLLEVLFERCGEVYAAFTMDSPNAMDTVFDKPVRTAAKLERMAGTHGHTVTWRYMTGVQRSDGLAQLEEFYDDYDASAWTKECPDVELYTALNPFSECEYVASRILRLVREEGLRYRDIVVVAPDPSGCRQALEAVFERCEIPLFVSEKADMLSKSLIALVLSALDTVSSGFEADDLLRYLKTGLTDVADADVDRLENYILRWKLRGRAFSSGEAWEANPNGLTAGDTPESQEALAHLNELRRQVCEPLIALWQGLREQREVMGKAGALYAFLERIGLPDTCERLAQERDARGEHAQADELRQLWDILCRALDSLVQTAGELCVDMEIFAELVRLVLSRYDVGVIPSALDRVHFGGMASAAGRHPKVLFLIGATDDVLPAQMSGGGILSDGERDVLDGLGLELQVTTQGRTEGERFALYTALSAPERLLIISHPAFTAGGAVQRASMVFSRVQALLPAVRWTKEEAGNADFRLAAPATALEYALTGKTQAAQAARARFAELDGYREALDSLCRRADNPRGPIESRAVRRGLYGSSPRLSASNVDTYYECPYKYFARYGLRLQARKPAAFDAPESGSYLHYVMENTVREIEQRYGSWKNVDEETVLAVGQAWSDRYVVEKLGGLRGRSARFVYLFHRIRRTLDTLLRELYAEFSLSSFQPMDFELDFSLESRLGAVEIPLGGGVTATLSGKVDRVDGWLHEGALYLRVVDYKSGNKEFSLTEIAAGIGMQLPLYLFVLGQRADAYRDLHPELPGEISLAPAGILYAPINAPLHSAEANLSQERLTAELLKKGTRKGLLIEDEEVLQAMEPGLAGRFIPVTVNSKNVVSHKHTASAQQFEALGAHVRELLQQMGKELRDGRTQASPRMIDSVRTSCDFCDYRAVCHFDVSDGDRYRKLIKTDLDDLTGNDQTMQEEGEEA